MVQRKLRMGMVGGGNNAFIGAIHRIAAFMDNQIELVCGCFSSNPEISLESGRSYFLSDERIYSSYKEMFERERALPDDIRMDFVAIVTPNHAHFEPAMMAIEGGFDIVIDKPITFSLEQAKALQERLSGSGVTLALTHTYSGYPAVKEARARFARGDFGAIRKIYVEYPQGWLSERIEILGGNNAGWRTDPKRSGKAGCMGDIGTHAMHLAEYISGLRCTSMCADLTTFVDGRLLDDDGAVLLRFDSGAKGVLMASQIAIGEPNAIKIRIYGDKGAIRWEQQNPNILEVLWGDRPSETYHIGSGYMGSEAQNVTRTPAGHPEGYLEAFANIYRNFAYTVRSRRDGHEPEAKYLDFPGIEDGVRGMQFIESVVTSSREQRWIDWIRN